MNNYDVAIIGGGPAGLMAAVRASELGAQVIVLEKNDRPGKKLLMSGGGRCNFTNNSNSRDLALAYGLNGRWLFSALSRFGVQEIIDFFVSRGVKIKVENNNRVFPCSDSAQEILKTLLNVIKTNGVEIKTNSIVSKIIKKKNKIDKLILSDGTEIKAANFIIACGGQSYPFSGSSGEAYAWLKLLGHKIIKPKAALSQIIVKENIKPLEGLSLKGGELFFYKNNKRVASEVGDFIFTNRGLSGPAALNLSRLIARHDLNGLKVKIDFFPAKKKEELEKEIQELVDKNKKVDLKNIFSLFGHKRLIDYILNLSDVNPNKKGNGLMRQERKKIVDNLKELTFSFIGLGGFNEAMITVGGLDLKEINQKTMCSRLFDNLYFAGEILDLDGPTGGYNLQIAWTTGYLAGEAAAENLA